MSGKALIVLQENSGSVPLPLDTPPQLQQMIFSVIDSVAETFEDIKTRLQAAGRYQVVRLLTDNLCTRANLLSALVEETRKGRVIDLVVLGHGTTEALCLKGTERLTGGPGGNIRSLKRDAQAQGVQALNLRLVYMCNCNASTLNDDWLEAGAKVSIGSYMRNYMPEPVTTLFLHQWFGGAKAKDAARKAFDASIPLFTPVYQPTTRVKYKTVKIKTPSPTLTNPLRMVERTVTVPDGVEFIRNTKIDESELVVGGDVNCLF
jgi:hypothetical protein